MKGKKYELEEEGKVNDDVKKRRNMSKKQLKDWAE